METLEKLKSGQLTGQTSLKLCCGLSEFPAEIFELADSLELLVLSDNQLTGLPEDFARLKQLKILFLNNNCFEDFPRVLADCPRLSMVSFKGNQIKQVDDRALSPRFRWLILTDNQLGALPASIGKLDRLQKLMLAGNRLRSLPEEMANCRNLELIRLSANQLQQLPQWLFALPRLSWLAYAGNPFCQAILAHRPVRSLPKICPSALQLGDTLGQGASGIIYKGVWETKAEEVAVKIFKGDITSDGLPADEMQACIAAGDHPNLVSVLGQLDDAAADTAERKAGLIFSMIPADYHNLGNPPSLESCTRDTYSDQTSFTLPIILKIAQGMASAAAHLHRCGIMHGDLYAHNILVNHQGESFLGDFGAASFYHADDHADDITLAHTPERLEVRAFGCLLEDLLDRYSPNSAAPQAEAKAIAQLRSLQQDCMQPNPAKRPLFTHIFQQVSDL
ncbi:MAG: serine/threonine-protein kinase [Phormidesmis sp. RL_2_1]|nr:serine/threonine-protein kinase [Phormidesmis sp. RL_2_1]